MRESPNRTEMDRVAVDEQVAKMEPEVAGGHEVDLIDLLLVLSQRKKRILQITIAVAIVAVIVALLLPKMYTATATILPPQESQSTLSSMLGQFGALGLASKDLGLKNPSDLFVAMLKSRSIEDRLVDDFDLRKVYGVKTYLEARRNLEGRSQITAGDEGLITISVTDRDPKRAAALANAYVDGLHSLNEHLAISEAAQRRLFYQQKLDAEREDLSRADLALRQVQEASGLMQPDAQEERLWMRLPIPGPRWRFRKSSCRPCVLTRRKTIPT